MVVAERQVQLVRRESRACRVHRDQLGPLVLRVRLVLMVLRAALGRPARKGRRETRVTPDQREILEIRVCRVLKATSVLLDRLERKGLKVSRAIQETLGLKARLD